MDQQKLRKIILLKRDALNTSEQEINSILVRETVKKLVQFQSADIILMYVDFRSELGTRKLMEDILEGGKTLVVPVTLVEERDLLPVSITNPDKELISGYCSIPEPIESLRTTAVVSPEDIDIIFLPGSVFDERGGRMGYGGGYYDRFVSKKAPQALRVGLAHDIQLVKEAPLQRHDELLDYVITEKRKIIGKRQEREEDAQNSNI